MPTLIIPPPYRGPTRGESEVRVAAGSARACLEAVEAEHPGFVAQVLDGQGGLHRFVRLFVNGEPLEADGLELELAEDDRLEIVAAIAGG